MKRIKFGLLLAMPVIIAIIVNGCG